MNGRAPSWSFGFRRAVELWRVVLAVFFVSVTVFVPVQFVVWTAIGGAFAALPDGELPDGETALILTELLRPVAASLVVAVVSGFLALWAWTVLWHAGAVRWFVYSGRRGVRLAEILSRGLFGWWRWARLGLVSVAAVVLGNAVILFVFNALDNRARADADDSRLGVYFVVTVGLSLILTVFCWLATLRGAWRLGEVDRRSAVMAWFAGLVGTVKQPLRSLWVLVAWALPAIAFSTLPLVTGLLVEPLRAPFASTVVNLASGLIAAFCLVGLFLSFAPATGLAGTTATSADS